MTLLEGLKKAQIEAAKAKDALRLSTLRLLSSAIQYREIEKRASLQETEIVGVIQTLCKQRREAIEQFEKGGRTDLVAKEKKELAILTEFLPPQLSREEVLAKARDVIRETGAQSQKEMGKVMKLLMEKLAGHADGSLVSSVVKELLQ